MDDRRLQRELESWLAAEAGDDAVTADRALTVALAAVPRLAPRPGFAGRVVAALPAAAAPAASWALRWRVATLAALVLAGLSAAFLPLVRWLPIERPSPGALVGAMADAAVDLALWLGAGLDAWSFLTDVGRALGVAATTPPIATALAATAAVGAAALYTLHHLLTLERRAWS